MCADCVENELHALLQCPLYGEIRKPLIDIALFVVKYEGFLCFSKDEQLNIILCYNEELLVKQCAKRVVRC